MTIRHRFSSVDQVANSWWRHQMEKFSAFLAICAGNSPVTGEFPAQKPVTRNLDVFVDLRLNKRLRKQSWDWWFEMPSRSLWRHCNVCPAASAPTSISKISRYRFRRSGTVGKGVDRMCAKSEGSILWKSTPAKYDFSRFVSIYILLFVFVWYVCLNVFESNMLDSIVEGILVMFDFECSQETTALSVFENTDNTKTKGFLQISIDIGITGQHFIDYTCITSPKLHDE